MVRKFVYDGRDFPDRDPTMSVDEVRASMVPFFPELANAKSAETKEGDDTVITFTRNTGTKGAL